MTEPARTRHSWGGFWFIVAMALKAVFLVENRDAVTVRCGHLIVLALLCACASVPSKGESESFTALTGGLVIDGTGAPARSGWTVLIRGDRITAVGSNVRVPPGANVIDVSGSAVLPGLIDMHGHHYARVGGRIGNVFAAYPALYLAGGVTTIRSPGDLDPSGMLALKNAVARGEINGPRMFIGGYYIDHKPSQIRWFEPIETPEQVAALVTAWKDSVDVVKFYTSVTDAELQAGIAAARKVGLPTTAHLGSITASRAIDLGIGGLEHGLYAMAELGAPNPSPRAGCLLGELDINAPEVRAVIHKIVNRRVPLNPTFVVFMNGLPDFAPVTPDWRRYFADSAHASLAEQRAKRVYTGQADTSLTCALRTRANALAFIGKVHARGGIILAGTDPVSPFLLPGWGLHREIYYLTQAGLSPLEAIKSATYNAAVVLRREREFGSISVGKLADLVIVRGDPSRRIEDLGNTQIVFKAGKRHDPVALRKSVEGMLREPSTR